MGIFKGLKNLFYDETEEPKKEVEQPKEEIKEVVSERELFQTEPTFKFPVIFDNEEIEEPKAEKKVLREIPKSKEFKRSEIISPVYGVLKEAHVKEEPVKEYIPSEKVDLDSIRQKAYGEQTTREEKYKIPEEPSDFANLKEEEVEEKPNIEEKLKTIDELLKENNDDFYSLVDSMYEGNE